MGNGINRHVRKKIEEYSRQYTLDQWAREGKSEQWKALVYRYARGANTVEDGSTRLTFVYSDHVIKLPYWPGDCVVNEWEYKVFRRYPFPCAECEIVDRPCGIPVLKMELVSAPVDFNPFEITIQRQHPWLETVGDGRQVGFNLEGKLVAYDYAHKAWGLGIRD
jgi:hypothetical protein